MSRAYTLADVCVMLKRSRSWGYKQFARGRFPIPHLPRKTPGQHPRFSDDDINSYFATAATADVKPRLRVVGR